MGTPSQPIVLEHRALSATDGWQICSVNQLIRSAAENTLDRPRYACAAPTYKEAESIAWSYHRYCEPIPGVTFNEAKLRVRYRVEPVSNSWARRITNSLRGPYLDGIVLMGYAFADPEAWRAVIRPQLTDDAIFIGTARAQSLLRALRKRNAGPDFLQHEDPGQ